MNKIDSRLSHELMAFRQMRSARDVAHAPRRRIGVFVQFTGDLETIKRQGLAVQTVVGNVAIGTAELEHIEKIAALDNVIFVEGERQERPQLKVSVPEIRANQVWSAPLSMQGEKMVVGIVDTGIDIYHQAFRNSDGSTRILSIFDLHFQVITITGSPTGGTFTLSVTLPGAGAAPPLVTAAIPFNASSSDVRSALVALAAVPNITAFDLALAGGPLPGTPIIVGFIGKFAGKTFPLMSVSSVFTGGTTPSIAITRGRRFSQDDINFALTHPGAPFDHKDYDGHGTHVAGTAAGDGSQSGGTPTDAPLECTGDDTYIGVAPRADLIIAKTTFISTDTVAGVAYIFQEAAAKPATPTTPAEPAKPAVVNISLGGQIGAHDGTSQQETALDALLMDTATPPQPIPGRAIVVAAGNDRDAGLHSAGRVPGTGTVSFEFIIPPKDLSMDRFDIWYSGPGRLRFTLTSPPGAPTNGAATGAVNPNGPSPPQTIPNHNVTVSSSLNDPLNNKHEIFFTIAGTPAAPGGAPRAIATGPWRITLQETAGSDVDFDCWIELQKKDKNPAFRDVDRTTDRTLTIPATARNVITVGAYDAHTGALADFSNAGPALTPAPAPNTLPPNPTTIPDRLKPDIVAPGVGVIAAKSGARGIWICCDCCLAFYVAMDGTSMAAPHITGVVALMLQRNGNLNFRQIRDRLQATGPVSATNPSRRPPPPPPPPPLPSTEWGFGKVDARTAAETALPFAAVDLRELQEQLVKTAAGQTLAALVSTHFDEVLRLINRNRRAATLWHRMGGPALVRQVLTWRDVDSPLFQPSVAVSSFSKYLNRLLAVLARLGSAQLRRDVAEYGAFVAAIPGLSLQQLNNPR
jgi:subtilisin family serine protease